MKSIYSALERITILALLSVILLACGSATARAENSSTLSKKELITLLANAHTPADQQKLAAYYHYEAQRLTAKSQDFSSQAEILAKQPATIESKQGISCQCTSHYRYFSKLYAQEAKDAEALAIQHDQLAKNIPDARP
ncbi:MAG TPA: hypothetical protein VGO27_18600 [Candidatus Acidoferrum sp.]|nr:hypothetical protein [Candidatus Acidoferrum sp.]